MVIALCTTLMGLVLALVLPNHYTAVTSILPPQQSSSSSGSAIMSQLSSLSALGGVGTGSPLKNPNDMQVALLRSRTVEDAVIDRFKLGGNFTRRSAHRKRARCSRNGLKLIPVQKDGIIRISVTGYGRQPVCGDGQWICRRIPKVFRPTLRSRRPHSEECSSRTSLPNRRIP